MGNKIEIKTIGGNTLHLDIPPNFNLNEELIIPREGMSALGSASRGDLYVKFIIKQLPKLSEEAKALLRKLKKEWPP